ncbi:AAA family ATPase [Methanobrevibacter sp.]|uniref:AAA family ATPase n=1 Tax=Methanobrevibacter sp. TaxID=66852 RepID=UPI0026004412|nr:AAA family ATPase [Methanobrevibacter sp.]MEE0024984.1 AAA family ATPase [Methanobrevibacter sp.]
MSRGLGKGLDSLIPEFYDEDFDSNSAQSLEDMLNDDADESGEKEPEVEKQVGVDDDGEGNPEKDNETRISSNEDKTKDEVDISESEDLHSDKDSEESVSNPQEIKRQENVAEVLDIVDKNPRITLWSSRSAAVFRYLRKTEPEFSISREASILIDEAVSKKYPDIWDLFEDLK